MSCQENIPAHTPRPPNAFLCFRSRFIRDQKASSEPRGKMQDLSRQAAQRWNSMGDEERRPYVDLASRMKAEHKVAYPDYKYMPNKRGGHRAQSSRPSRRGQSTPAPMPVRQKTEPSFTPESSPGVSHPMPVLSSSYTPPPVTGDLQLHRYDSLWLPAAALSSAGQNQDSAFYYASSHRSISWDSYPPPFWTPDGQEPSSGSSSSSRAPQEFSYHDFEQTPRAFEPQPDFGSLCRWDDDFSGPYASSSTSSAYYRSY